MYELAVFIGRFSPFHNGHETVIKHALTKAKKVLVLIGSSNRPATIRNPYSYETRSQMVQRTVKDARVMTHAIEDIIYNDQLWISQIQEVVSLYAKDNIALVGFKKDETSYYLDMFPQWDSIDVPPVTKNDVVINATYIRQRLFEGNLDISVISTESAELAANGMTDRVREEYKHVLAYKQQFSGYPYPPIFHTVDAVVVQSGHVLLVKRGAMPGKGLLALPGGFLNAHEKRLDGMLRELREETKIKVPERVLYGNIIKEETFDEPNRSSRGRTITTAYTIMLPNGPLPKIKGADDAEKAMWVPLSAVASNMMFEDHFDIIQVMVGKREKTC